MYVCSSMAVMLVAGDAQVGGLESHASKQNSLAQLGGIAGESLRSCGVCVHMWTHPPRDMYTHMLLLIPKEESGLDSS